MFYEYVSNIVEMAEALQPRVLDRLVANISSLASVYHEVPEAFCDTNRRGQANLDEDIEASREV